MTNTSDPLMENPLEMNYPQLKAHAAKLGIDASGKKDELLARIQEHTIKLMTGEAVPAPEPTPVAQPVEETPEVEEAKELYKAEVERELPQHIKDDIREQRRTQGDVDVIRARKIVDKCLQIFNGRAQVRYNEGDSFISFVGGIRQAEDALLGQPEANIYAHATRFVARGLRQGAVGNVGANQPAGKLNINDLSPAELQQLKRLLNNA